MRLGQNSALNRKTSGVLPLGNFHWFFMYGRFDAYMYYALFIQDEMTYNKLRKFNSKR